MSPSLVETDLFPSDIRMYNCGYYETTKDETYGPSIRLNWIVYFFCGGSGEFQLNKQLLPIRKNDILLVTPGDFTLYTTSPARPWRYFWFTFNGTMGEFVADSLNLSRDKPLAHVEEPAAIQKAMEEIIDAKYENDFLVLGKLYTALGLIKNQTEEKAPGFFRPNTFPVSRAVSYIENHYADGINSVDVAKHLQLERTYFSKLFKAKTGIPPQKYITRHRILAAAKLLETTSLPVVQIAQSVGFHNLAYFYRIFKKHHACTPEQYRKPYRT